MKDNLLISLSKEFAIDIINVYNKSCYRQNVLLNQLLRCGTSIGANIHEGNYAVSRSDFINKFQIALKECYETAYWLDIFRETKLISVDDYNLLITKCNKIRKILSSSIKTAKKGL